MAYCVNRKETDIAFIDNLSESSCVGVVAFAVVAFAVN